MTERDDKYDPAQEEPLPEGEEAPPPLTRTMGIIRWALLIGLSLFAAVMVLSFFGLTPWEGHAAQAVQYHCPMHPTYISSRPGECPICGMSLVPIDTSGKEIQRPAPAQAVPESTNVPRAKPGQYMCPMDPEIVSDSPGRCPICNMPLELVKDSSQTQPAEHEHSLPGMTGMAGMTGESTEAVAGLVPVTIEPQRLQLIGLRTAKAERRGLGEALDLVGYVTADETRVKDTHVRASGWVQELYVDQTGQSVAAGQPLLSIYSQDLYQAEQDFLVAQKAVAAGSGSNPILAQMRAQMLEVAHERLGLLGLSETEIEALSQNQQPSSQLLLRSPFSGYVLDKAVVRGQFVSPEKNLFTIADLSRVWVIGDVYEQDLAEIRVGQAARLRTTASPGQEFRGTISFIYPTVSEGTRTLKVRLEFPNPDLRLRPGMYAEISVDMDRAAALAVPSDAVLDGGEQQYVFVVHDGNHFEPRLVKPGRSSDDWTEILSGLSEGDEVVTSANFLIDSESRLQAAITGMGGTAESRPEHVH